MTRRSAELRLDALLRTAVDVIVERGLARTRTADVAAAAGVSPSLVFYHFANKEALLAQAFAYVAEQDLARMQTVIDSKASPTEKLAKLLKQLAPTGRSVSWAIWIDGWSEAMRVPELEKVSRRMDLRWKEALTGVIAAGVADGSFTCDDPVGAAWRINALIDGLAVQLTVHDKVISRKQTTEWVRLATAREIGISPNALA
ncbi:AcrR family transcriptional regulator [Allocatelliglobosispora scoriae]|uniref:AcrR family transcriptional regulator n=1 Tax=Allocatelliglobosispora scoriae TaxID=643052 RepID=A0A841BTC7_9ACTN|nr:TetR/AcrR family transcriptional regulator [Allocatelliglobosispora scoriae]MBB5870173.1 AcrR family transcriptional regulator [Allocatelliglobosispora scoriae]